MPFPTKMIPRSCARWLYVLAVGACGGGELSENLVVLGSAGENRLRGAPWGAEPPASVSPPVRARVGTFTDFTARTCRPGEEMSLGFADEKKKREAHGIGCCCKNCREGMLAREKEQLKKKGGCSRKKKC